MAETRRATVRALAKINLDLRVIGKRDDGYHELRTVFQTVSLADRIELAFTPGRRTEVELRSSIDIADNLVVKAARVCLDAMKRTGRLEVGLEKRIPMGAGLGGGSSDAAAVLLALPVLTGGFIPFEDALPIATSLGSDVPFFLMGGRAAGIGRGSELYPLPDLPAQHGLLLAPGLHVSTPDAYRSLNRGRLTTELLQNNIDSFQALAWSRSPAGGSNDFEEAVFRAIPQLASLKRKLIKAGASPAMMSGSGSALFGLFGAPDQARRALDALGEQAVPITLVSRSRYQALWRRWLATHRIHSKWPLRSRYAR